MVDRRLAGILGISAILSTLVSIGIYRQVAGGAVEVAVNTFPANLPWAGYARPRFVTDLVATKDLPDLVAEYSMLKRVDPVLAKPWSQASHSPDGLAGNVMLLNQLEQWLERCRAAGLDLSADRREMRVRVNGSDARLHIFDYTRAYEAFGLGPAQLYATDTVWAFLVDDSGNVSTYAGIRDFFYDRLTIIYSLDISDRAGSESYASSKMPPELRGDKPGIGKAPAMGTVHRREIWEGDRIHVVFDLIGESMFRHEGFLQLIVIRTGLGESMLANFIGTSPSI